MVTPCHFPYLMALVWMAAEEWEIIPALLPPSTVWEKGVEDIVSSISSLPFYQVWGIWNVVLLRAATSQILWASMSERRESKKGWALPCHAPLRLSSFSDRGRRIRDERWLRHSHVRLPSDINCKSKWRACRLPLAPTIIVCPPVEEEKEEGGSPESNFSSSTSEESVNRW